MISIFKIKRTIQWGQNINDSYKNKKEVIIYQNMSNSAVHIIMYFKLIIKFKNSQSKEQY